jgi:hypothetical protein
MNENSILTYAERMIEDMRGAVQLAHLPTGPQALERELLDAEMADVADIATVAHLLSMANAAFVVADAGIDGIVAPWYRDIGLRLLRQAVGGLNVVEAVQQRPGVGLN